MLQVRNPKVRYGGAVLALQAVSLDVPAGRWWPSSAATERAKPPCCDRSRERSPTAAENLRAGAFTAQDRARRAASARRVHELFPVLHERHDQRAGLLSGGRQQMLAIGRALMACPRMLLIDEPSLGLLTRLRPDRLAAPGVARKAGQMPTRAAYVLKPDAVAEGGLAVVKELSNTELGTACRPSHCPSKTVTGN